jgi:hypothetical protein
VPNFLTAIKTRYANTVAAETSLIKASQYAATPPATDAAMTATGMNTGSPFGPGTPLHPYAGYGGEPRRFAYPAGYNIQTRADRDHRVSFDVLKDLIDNYDIARMAIGHRIDDVRSLDWSLVPKRGFSGDTDALTQTGYNALKYPEGPGSRLPFRAWVAKYLEDVLRYDAGTLFRRRDRANRVIGLKVVSGRTVAPLVDYWGDTPISPAPAFAQFVQGVPWKSFTTDDLIYVPFRPQSDSMYGFAPLEAVLLSANCYSDDTEVLTSVGWKRFADVDITQDQIATRSPITGAFEWQWATKFHHAPNDDGVMFHAKSRNVDLLVTGGHRLLVEKPPAGVDAVKHGDHWLVHAEDVFNYQQSLPGGGRPVRVPVTSGGWDAPDLQWFHLPYSDCDWVHFDPDVVRVARAGESLNAVESRIGGTVTRPTLKRAGQGLRVTRRSARAVCAAYGLTDSVVVESPRFFSGGMSGDSYAAFMGMWLSEGSVRASGSNIEIAQIPESKGFEPFRVALAEILGTPAPYDGRMFVFGHAALAEYLRQFGHAHQKFIPAAILGMSARQLRIFWRFYMLGDGHYHPGGSEIITTVSPQIADGLQEILQKIGGSASIHLKGSPIKETHNQTYTIGTREKSHYRVTLEKVEYDRNVYCVSVPNKTLFVRRNGVAAWCANTDLRFQMHFLMAFTDANVPKGFMSAPEGISNPDQLTEMQEYWDALLYGDQAVKHQMKLVPHGTEFEWPSFPEFDDKFPTYLMRKVAAAYHVPPNELGFTDDVNRSTSESQVDVNFRIGTKPLYQHLQDIFDPYLQDDLGLPLEFKFDAGQEIEDRVSMAQAHQIYVNMGAESVDEVRSAELGLPVDNEHPVPRFVNNPRTGPVPLTSIFAIGGVIDAETAAPDPAVPLGLAPFDGTPGLLPDKSPGGAEFTRAPLNPDEPQFPGLEGEVPGSGVIAPPAPAGAAPVAKGAGVRAAGMVAEVSAFNRFVKARRKAGVWRDFTFTAASTLDGHRLNQAGRALVRKAAGEIVAAGLCVQAADTGRVLMLQRGLDPLVGEEPIPLVDETVGDA